MSKEQFLLQRVDNNEIKIANEVYSCRLSPFDADLQKVGQYLTQAILLEVSTHPNPGLVTRLSNGAHKDMSIFTFMMSSAVLSKAFNDLQDIGQAHRGTLAELFCKLRSYGVGAEAELLRVTKGVLFAGGIVSAVSGYAMNMGLSRDALLPLIKEMAAGLVARELKNLDHAAMTAGEKLYYKYGITGIRGEVENGFPSVVNYGLPALEDAFDKGATINDALVHALISLMTVVEDSNVIWRTDYDTLLEVQRIAKNILSLGSVFAEKGRMAIAETERYFLQRHISPGGSADLLSVTITLYLLEHKEFPRDIF